MSFVVDASVAISWTVLSQASPETELLLDKVFSGERVVASTLWPFEVSNSLLMLVRRKRLTEDDFREARGFLDGLRVSVDEDGIRLATSRVTELAREHGLTVYDAAYLELALRKKLPLASRDADLNRAATACGVVVLL